MALFHRGPIDVRLDKVELAESTPPRTLWTDGFGKLAIRSLQVILVVTVAVGIVWVLRSITLVAIPLVLALILASAFAPIVGWMIKHRVPSILAALITLLTVVALLGGVGWLIVTSVRNEWEELSTQAREGFDQVVGWVQTLPFAPDQAQLDEWRQQITEFATSSQVGSGALAGVSAITSFIAGFVLLVVILFFFLKDGPLMWEFLLRPFRGENYARGHRIGKKSVTVLGAYVRGTASVAFVDAVGILIGLLILQVPLAIPLAALVFVLAFIPIVGAVLAGIIAALVALVANDPLTALLVVGVVVLVNQLEGNFLQPVLMGRSMRLHSFVILVALAAGTAVGGILGGVLAVPIAAVVWGIVQVWDGDDLPARWARPRAREEIVEKHPETAV